MELSCKHGFNFPREALNETISGNVSGATGIFVSQIDNKITLKDITGLFNTSDSLQGYF